MNTFKQVAASVWDNEMFIGLSQTKPSGQALWIYLLTSVKTASVIPGLVCAEKSDMALHLCWAQKSFNRYFNEILKKNMAEYDESTAVLWLPNAVRYNHPDSPDELAQWAEYAESIPDCDIKTRALDRIYQELCDMDKKEKTPAFVPAFNQFFSVKQSGTAGRRHLSVVPSF